MKMDETELSNTYVKVLCDFGANAVSVFLKKYDENICKYLMKMVELIETNEL